MIDLHLFALNCNESFRIVVDEKEKRAKLCCLTLSILVFYVKCFIINLLGLPAVNSSYQEQKDHEIRELGEFRTKRLVLEVWKKN